MQDAIIRIQTVVGRTGLSRSTIYQRISEGRFPSPINLGAKAVGWIEREVQEWLTKQIERSRGGAS